MIALNSSDALRFRRDRAVSDCRNAGLGLQRGNPLFQGDGIARNLTI